VQTLGSSLLSNFDLERWEFVREHEDMELRTREKRHFTGPYFVNLWGSLELLRSPGGGQKLENIARQYIYIYI